MNQANRVPIAAQSSVTTTVRLTVFQSNWPVRLRKSRGCSVDHPVWNASTTRKIRGVTTAKAITTARAKRAGGPVRWCPGQTMMMEVMAQAVALVAPVTVSA